MKDLEKDFVIIFSYKKSSQSLNCNIKLDQKLPMNFLKVLTVKNRMISILLQSTEFLLGKVSLLFYFRSS